MASVLIVDDEDSIRTVIRKFMAMDNHVVHEACNGDEALKIVLNPENKIDIVITDLVMPVKNGLDLIMELKKNHAGVKILAISGGGGISGRFDYLPIAKLVGAKEIITKPFEMAELRQRVLELTSG